jgi:solute carrier family 35 protein C2
LAGRGGCGRDHEPVSDEDLHSDAEMGLTTKERRRKQETRRHNTQLDQRIAKEPITIEERKEADQTVLRRLTINGSLILLWYLFSLSISLVCSSNDGFRFLLLGKWTQC